jgi:hypothetical protein
MTEWHARYGGRGVMIYWHVERDSVCIHSRLRRCSSSEAAAAIEGVLPKCTPSRSPGLPGERVEAEPRDLPHTHQPAARISTRRTCQGRQPSPPRGARTPRAVSASASCWRVVAPALLAASR